MNFIIELQLIFQAASNQKPPNCSPSQGINWYIPSRYLSMERLISFQFTATSRCRRLAFRKIISAETRRTLSVASLDYKTLLLSYNRDGHLARIELNRPSKKNAFSKLMYHELETALREISDDHKIKVILLTGSGDTFSAGNDLSNFSEVMHPLTIAKQSREICYSFVDSFICCKKPIIVAVNGPAFGIAVTVLGLCDKVFSSTTASFKTPFAELGQVTVNYSTSFHLSNLNTTNCMIPPFNFLTMSRLGS